MKPTAVFSFLLLATSSVSGDDWPQWMGPNRDAVWAEAGVAEKFPAGGPKVLWRTPIGGGYAGPAVVGGRVYVMDYVTKDDVKKENFKRDVELSGEERVLCLDAADGKVLWKHAYPRKYTISYPSGPRCTPNVHAGKVYALGAEGDLWGLDAETGKVLWSKNFASDYQAKTPIWGFAAHPLVDGKKLICVVGGKDALAVAFDKDTGRELWRSLSAKEPGYCPPTIIDAGGARQLLIWHGEALNGLDPETGKPYWSVPLAPRYGMSVMAPRKSGYYLYAGATWGIAVALKLDPAKPAVTKAWRGVESMKGKGLYPMNMTPFVDGGVLYGADQPGQFRAVRIDTGEQLWESWKPVTGKEQSRPVQCGTVFVVKNGPRFFLFNERGELIIAKLDPKGYHEVGRAKLLEPTGVAYGRPVVWSHPAFANKCCYARNDKEFVAVSLAQ